MANAIFMFILLVVIGEAFVIWLMNDELKQRSHVTKFHEGLADIYREKWEALSLKAVNKPHTMTAKDIAAGNLTRQVQRRGKSWADIRNRVESAFEHDPENDTCQTN
jgi:hypothetical protein